jgi:uncharacterized protein (TIGR02147 family)
MANKSESFKTILFGEWMRRQKVNQRYSLRAFSSSLQISPSRLSEFFSGKGGLSPEKAMVLAERLNFSGEQLNRVQMLIHEELGRSSQIRELASTSLKKHKKKFSYASVVSTTKLLLRLSWDHLILVELVSNESLHATELQNRLGIGSAQFDFLSSEAEKMGLLERATKPGFWRAKKKNRLLGGDKMSETIRRLHYQFMKKAQTACEACRFEERELSSSLLQLSSEQVEKLRQMIQGFAKDAVRESNQDTENKKKLYGLGIQLFPIERGEEEA